jgi:hypothetical protein
MRQDDEEDLFDFLTKSSLSSDSHSLKPVGFENRLEMLSSNTSPSQQNNANIDK